MRSPVRVFIVEDSPLIRKRIIENLQALGGFDVVGFAEAESPAVAAIASIPNASAAAARGSPSASRTPPADRAAGKSSSSRGATSERANAARARQRPGGGAGGGGTSTRRTSTPRRCRASIRAGTLSSTSAVSGRSTAVTSCPAATSSSTIVQAAIVLPEWPRDGIPPMTKAIRTGPL